ncbi:hypothetical protein JYU34_002223 [Plutella xylostella]|uniref:Uncharacterized protein n=1 Tax=Plutella xylostella TaxID=51655 RepID=A0ABQ7R1N9_PLUXY|nr:hypothetical protein JYU34_002223 [Plutella xylostella]
MDDSFVPKETPEVDHPCTSQTAVAEPAPVSFTPLREWHYLRCAAGLSPAVTLGIMITNVPQANGDFGTLLGLQSAGPRGYSSG